uniref:Uncharacterized protein n=1 Tax=Anguilla anguilla TaxID=7936 RepID=A0A0E9VDD7_ANGAN
MKLLAVLYGTKQVHTSGK